MSEVTILHSRVCISSQIINFGKTQVTVATIPHTHHFQLLGKVYEFMLTEKYSSFEL